MNLVAGGAGFIGAKFVLNLPAQFDEAIVDLDVFSHEGKRENSASLASNGAHFFVQGDIGNSTVLANLLARHQFRVFAKFANKRVRLLQGTVSNVAVELSADYGAPGFARNDPAICIPCLIQGEPILSAKDQHAKQFAEEEHFA